MRSGRTGWNSAKATKHGEYKTERAFVLNRNAGPTPPRLSETPECGEAFRDTRMWRGFQRHQNVARFSETPECGEAFRDTRMWRGFQRHQNVARLSETPECGEAFRDTRMWRGFQRHQNVAIFMTAPLLTLRCVSRQPDQIPTYICPFSAQRNQT